MVNSGPWGVCARQEPNVLHQHQRIAAVNSDIGEFTHRGVGFKMAPGSRPSFPVGTALFLWPALDLKMDYTHRGNVVVPSGPGGLRDPAWGGGVLSPVGTPSWSNS